MKEAAHLMVQSLTCSLALVTCKEPLRVSISNHLRALLIANNADVTLAEMTVQQVRYFALRLLISFYLDSHRQR
jgi:hypothetical protein